MFKLKNKLDGPKKHGQEPTAIRYINTNDLVVTAEDINRVPLWYCVNNLNNSEPSDKVREMVVRRTKKQKERMNNNDGETFDINIIYFQEELD